MSIKSLVFSAAVAAALVACSGKYDTAPVATDTDTDTDADTEPPAPQPIRTIAGDMTWAVNHSKEAEAAGIADCAYTRHYEGTEDRSAPWLCPSCEFIFRASVEMVDPDGCYATVSTADPAPQERLGWDGETWMRGSGDHAPLSAQGTATVGKSDVSVTNYAPDVTGPDGFLLEFDVSGTLDLGDSMGDPLNGYTPPGSYACGWPKADPPPYTGDWTVVEGEMLPDGWFLDTCEEPVRMHDFKGKWLVVDISAIDCPPCQSMAAGEHAFVEDMTAAGFDVEVITLMAPSLSDVLGITSTSELEDWTSTYGMTSPVLGDRGWGYGPAQVAASTYWGGFGYPTWIVVDPDLTVIGGGVGFGTWDEMAQMIEAAQ